MGARTNARVAVLVFVVATCTVAAVVPDTPIALRVVLGAVALYGSYLTFDFAMCARRWMIRGQVVDVPTMFDEERVIRQSQDGTTEIRLDRTGRGHVLRVSELVEGGRATSYDVPINPLVSRADIARWFDDLPLDRT
jgi:hypothetical protein